VVNPIVIDLSRERDEFNLGDTEDAYEPWQNKLALAFDPSGERLAIGGGETLRVYDTRDGRLVDAHQFVFVDGEDYYNDVDLSEPLLRPLAIVEVRFTSDGHVLVAHGVYPFVFPQGDLRSVLRAFARGGPDPFMGVCTTQAADDRDDGCHAWQVSVDGTQLMAITSRGAAVHDLRSGARTQGLDVFDPGDASGGGTRPDAFVGEPTVFTDDGRGSLGGWVPWQGHDRFVYLEHALRSGHAPTVRAAPNPAGWTVNLDQPWRDRPILAFTEAGDALIAASRGTAGGADPVAVYWSFAEPTARVLPLVHKRAAMFCPYHIDVATSAVLWSDASAGGPEISVVRHALLDGRLREIRVASPTGELRGAAMSRDGTEVARAVDDRVYVHRIAT
jgi:hypothetical protein